MLSSAAVVWHCRKQNTVSLSSSEAEYVACSEAAREVMWLRSFLIELEHPQKDATTLRVDNTTAILMATDDGNAARRKHINVKHHYILSLINMNEIKLEWVETAEQLADIFTKPLSIQVFSYLRACVMGHDGRDHQAMVAQADTDASDSAASDADSESSEASDDSSSTSSSVSLIELPQ